jgi:hypothetical protein
MIVKKRLTIIIIILFIGAIIIPNISGNIKNISATATIDQYISPTVVINIEPYTEVYEGDIIDC